MTTMIISNMHPRGFAFGITEDGEQVFIPPFLAKGAGVQTGDTVKAQVTINPQQSQRQSTPYIAVKIESHDDSQSEEIELSKEELRNKIDRDVYDAICVGSYISTSELAKDLVLIPRRWVTQRFDFTMQARLPRQMSTIE